MTRSVPLARSSLNRSSQAQITSIISGDKRIRVSHREPVLRVSGANAFTIVSLAINPGQGLTFPWLRNIALDYERYVFRSLRFEYRSTCAATVAGNIAMAVDYDAADDAPAMMVNMLSYNSAIQGNAWSNLDCVCAGADLTGMLPQRTIRYNALAANLDIKNYDVGNLFIAVEGFAATDAVGYLWVSYVVDLITPQLPSGADLAEDYYGSFTGNTPTEPFTVIASEAGEVAAVLDTSKLVFLRSGDYELSYVLTGTVMTEVNPTFTLSQGTVTSLQAPVANAAATGQVALVGLKNVPSGATLDVDVDPALTNMTTFVVRIARYNLS